MTEHTKTPWEVSEHAGYYEILALDKGNNWRGRYNVSAVAYADTSRENQEANARRIVAAVNATDCFSTADLEAGVVRELVEALRELDAAYENQNISHLQFRMRAKSLTAALLAKVQAHD